MGNIAKPRPPDVMRKATAPVSRNDIARIAPDSSRHYQQPKTALITRAIKRRENASAALRYVGRERSGERGGLGGLVHPNGNTPEG